MVLQCSTFTKLGVCAPDILSLQRIQSAAWNSHQMPCAPAPAFYCQNSSPCGAVVCKVQSGLLLQGMLGPVLGLHQATLTLCSLS